MTTHRQPAPVSHLTASPEKSRSPLMLVGLALLVVGVVAAVHWPVLSSQALCHDDEVFLFGDAKLRNPSWQSVGVFFSEVLSSENLKGYYEPLTQTSLMLDVAMGGSPQNLRPFHRTSLALHAASTALLMLLLFMLFHEFWTAALLALVFGLHPLMVEPLAWSWERKTTLAAFFVLISLLFYLAAVRRNRRACYVVSLGAFALALLAKPTSTPLPLLLLVLDWWPLKRLNRRAVLEKIPFFALAAISAAITLISTARNAEMKVADSAMGSLPLRMSYLLAFYLRKIVWPADLSPTYTMPAPLSLENPQVAFAVGAFLVLVAVVVAALKWTRAPLAAGAFFFFAILPTLGLVSYSWVTASDKYVYLPVIGLLLPLGALLARLWRRESVTQESASAESRPVPKVLIVALLVMLAAGEAYATRLTYRNWATTDALLAQMLRVAPRSSMAQDAYASALLRRGEIDEAIKHYRLAMEYWPLTPYEAYLPQLHRNLGLALLRAGDLEGAIQNETRALDYNPKHAPARMNLAQALVLANRAEDAVPHLERITGDPKVGTGAHALLAEVLAKSGRPGEAIPHYRAVLKVDPDNQDAVRYLGIALARSGDLEGAIAEFRRALRLNPANPAAYYNLGLALERKGELAEAKSAYTETLRLAPDHRPAQARLHALVSQPASTPG